MNDVIDFLSAWADAERTRDTAFLDAHLTDDFVGTGPLGFSLPKPAWLARHRGNDLHYTTFDLDEVDVRTHGSAAIVSAHQDAIGTFQGHPVPQHLRNTFVVVEAGRTWKLASLHMSFIAGTPGVPPVPGPPASHDEGGAS